MYFPYLYGKRMELIAVRSLSKTLFADARVQPLIEPVRKDAGSLKIALDMCEKNKLTTWVVVNPRLSHFLGEPPDVALKWGGQALLKMKSRACTQPTLILSESVQLSTIREFNDTYRGERVGLVVLPSAKEMGKALAALKSVKIERVFFKGPHPSMADVALAGKARSVWVEDRFPWQRRNADYTGKRFFTDRHATFPTSGWGGFSDYALMPSEPSDKGGPPGAVAFHLSYYDKANAQKHVHVEHFVSDRSDQKDKDTGGKFLEAMDKFAIASKRRGSSFGLTTAAMEYLDRNHRRVPPTLSGSKQLSVMHHIELMSGLMAGRY